MKEKWKLTKTLVEVPEGEMVYKFEKNHKIASQ